jgi:glycosyltransferase involved in cell wall biosynthesis
MGENGKKALREKYNWEAEQGKFLDIYEKVLNK